SIAVQDAPHGRAVVVRSPDGLNFTIDPLTPEAPRTDSSGAARSDRAPVAAQLSVAPLWFTPDTAAATRTLSALGARPRIASERGGWTDLVTDSGLVAVHAAGSAETTPVAPVV